MKFNEFDNVACGWHNGKKRCLRSGCVSTRPCSDNADSVCFVPPANNSATRKGMPLFSGCLMYFPDALLAIAEHSRKANDKHNPGEPLHWSKDKSKDHPDCIGRHLIDIGKDWNAIDPEFGSYHATALAWRALALLQTIIEREANK